MKKIAVLTSGGDAPGMNACIRAVVRYAIYNELTVYGVERGYNGLINNNMRILDRRSVGDMIHRGGTFLKTARCQEFNTLEGQREAARVIRERDIDGLIVIGGDGSMRGARDLTVNFGIPTVGIPGTIDNDLAYTDYTLGFDTAVNTALSAINNLRDTMTSHDRVSIIEVMGRHCGDIALYAGLAGGAEEILVPEMPLDIDAIAEKLKQGAARGKMSSIIVLAEGAGKAEDVAKLIEEKAGVSIRITTLGHIQRGGMPTMADRVLAAKFAVRAVELLKKGMGNRVVGIRDNKIIDMDIVEGLSMKREFDEYLYNVAAVLSL